MSSIKTTQIDGDVSIGRNIAMGGKAEIAGSVHVGHNMKVDGWLEAPNIKGANKGIFLTVQELREAYPNPHDGWMAGVGASTPFTAYVGKGGDWVATGGTIEVTVDMSQYTEGVEQLQEDIDAVKADVRTLETNVNSHTQQLTTLGNQLNNVQNTANAAKSKSDTNEANITALAQQLSNAAASLQSLSTDEQKKAYIVELSNYMEENSELPKAGAYVYNGNPVECRLCTLSEGDTAWLAFCISRGDDTGSEFGERVTECILYSTNAANDPFYFVGHYYDAEENIPQWVQELFGYSFAERIEEINERLTELGEADEALQADNKAHHAIKIGGIVTGAITIQQTGIMNVLPSEVYFSENLGRFVVKRDGKYYTAWNTQDKWMQPNTTTPYTEKQYILGSDIYMYDADDADLKQIGGSSSSGIFNVTNQVPISGYYVLCDTENTGISAVHAAWNAKKATSGLIISFEVGSGIWKTYQFIGKTVNEVNWYNSENWKDFGSLAAGSETYIIIDDMIGAPVAGEFYTLATAVTRLIEYQRETGVSYAKKGLIISYRTAENVMETKQFQGEVTGFGEIGLWKDFGGGSEVETSDEPEKDGKDALSTGGAYTHIPAGLGVDTETEGVVKLKLVNAEGDDVGDEIQFNVGTGSGGGTGTTIAVAFKDNPFYGKAGGSFLVKAAIMSVTKAGSQETSNSIMSVNFVNRTTKNTVAFFNPRKASSATLTDYSFEFDLSSLCQNAGELPLQAVITDDGGNTATKNISIIAVDVTCESVQTLNYTRETSLQVGGQKTSIPMYRFPNNASDRGIRTVVEIYKNGDWETLQDVVVNDTYPHNVSIDPTGLGHGAYPIRIQGTDVASGTRGNVLHTAVMVIEQREEVADYDKPIVVARWSDDSDGEVKLFETLKIDLACYQRSKNPCVVEVTMTNETTGTTETLSESSMYRNRYYTIEKRVVGYSQGDTLTFDAIRGVASLAETREVLVNGSLLDIAETEGALYKISLAGRSNTDTDKTIKTQATDGTEKEIVVTGSNYSTNGFVLDTFGTEQSGGRMSLRVAENVTAECTDQPFASSSIPTNGLALSLTFKVKNIARRDAHIIKCLGERLGFVLTGEKFIVTTNGDSAAALANVHTTAATSYLDDVVYRFDIVIEPQARAPYSGVMLCKVFQNGDMAACVPIDTSSAFPIFNDTIHFDGTDADLYLYEIVRWNTYYDFIQAFNNYIVNLTDTQAMLTEYEQNQVMADVTAEGVTKPRPDMQRLIDRGVMVMVETRTSDANLSKDGAAVTDSEIYYPDYIENIKDKKTSVLMDWYLYFPDRPWADCKIEAIPTTNQGTSTLAYAIKNKKGKAKKAKRITMLHTREEVSSMYNGDETILAKYDDAVRLAAKKKIRIKDGSTPLSTITVKVDYSDSAGANNCALMEQMNDVQLALGRNYMTPAQIFNTDSSEELHTSIDGVTCALFRTDYRIGQEKGSEAATLPENAYFHSKANFNADKDNPHFFGFEDVPGYNKGCVNYGDFKEIVTPRGTNIDAYKATVLAGSASLIPGTLYMISEFCGPETRFIENDGTGTMTETDAVAEFVEVDKTGAEIAADDVSDYDWATVYRSTDGKYYKYTGGVWRDTTGSMTYDSSTGKWVIVGRVLNPVECYEYRQYQELCWQQGVNSVDDMLETLHTDDGDVPIWSTYYESRYPDDDDLNDLYAQGRKVPYQLFRELLFCQQCNQNLTDDHEENAALNPDGSEKIFNGDGASLTITLDGNTVAGTKANRLLKWQHEMHHYFNPYSTNHYIVASDYKATVDQRAKNMMIAVYKETDGNMRYYFNHWYDGDSVDEADNDCYLTIPWDMDGANSHLYQGWDGVMFRQSFALFERGKGVWIDDNGTQLTLHDTAAAMRSAKTGAGLEIFSAAGSYRYWMTNRILKWPKVVSSFDGQRKYIETATAADNHYPALHGLRLESLPAFQRKRFAYRDGYYQTGDLFKHFFQARVMGAITVKITAAQDGYFGMGVDSTSSAKYSCYLQAGESYTFTETAAGVGGKLIYIFGADKLSELDLSGCTPKNSNWVIADCTLLRKLIIGGASYTPSYTDDILSALSLGQMPFLEEIDIRNTKVLTLNTSGCPRLKKVQASGSLLRSFTSAQSSPLQTLTLPATMSELSFVNLPNLGYPNGGITFEGLANVTRVQLSGCPSIDAQQLLADVISAGARLAEVQIDSYDMTGNSSTLEAMQTLGTRGIGSEQTSVCDGMNGSWTLSNLLEAEAFASLQAYFPNLTFYNAQYTMIEINDAEENGYDAAIRNLDNGTKDGEGEGYAPSGHITRLLSMMHVYKGTYNESTHKMQLEQISDSNMQQLANGLSCDLTDTNGTGYDIFLGFPHYWYKGINDHVNQKKYTAFSTEVSTPRSTATNINRSAIGNLLLKQFASVYVGQFNEGDEFSTDNLTDSSANNVYRMDVEGMKQVRWPGINSNMIGGLFLDSSGKVLSTVYTYVTSAYSDFVQGEYVFVPVPANAATFVFTTPNGYNDLECIAVDSEAIEAIEPDWVEHDFELIGCYKANVDNLMRLRSISNATPTRGTGTSSTYSNWGYDANGDLTTGAPQAGTTLNYTCKDFQNLARCRGNGYQLVDYEMHKNIANLWMAIHGRRNSQAVNGSGVNAGTITGGTDSTAEPSPFRETVTGRPRTLGLEDWWGNLSEWMDNVAINVPTYEAFYKNRCIAPTGSPVDAVWHIRMPDGTEREVQGITNSGDNQEIVRMRHGRYCDVIPSKCVTNANMNTYYSDAQWYSGASGRCVLRSGGNTNASFGFVHVFAGYDASYSNTFYGSRLAFRGAVEFVV